MEYFIYRDNQQDGPYTLDELQYMRRTGDITDDSNIWYEGLPEWIPYASLNKPTPKATASHKPVISSQPTKSSFPVLLIALAVLLVAAGSIGGFFYYKNKKENEPYELKGSVFVVTKGGANIKLGLVTINVYPEDTITKFLKITKEGSDKKLAELDENIAATQKSLDDADIELAKSEAAYKAYNSDSAEYSRLLDIAVTKESARNKFVDPLNALKKERREWNESYQEAISLAIPTSNISTKTDADGQFSILIPAKGRYILSAVSSRAVGDSQEKYFWLMALPEKNSEKYSIMLSNDNILPVLAPEFVHPQPFSGTPEKQ